MTSALFTQIQNVFAYVKSQVENLSSIKSVNVGEQIRIGQMPYGIINLDPSPCRDVAQNVIQVELTFTIVIVIREAAPENWFTDIVSPMCDAVAAVLKDRSLNQTVKNVSLVNFAPMEIKFNNRLYYGGAVRFTALMHYLPTGQALPG